jgi:hypothetical protein
LVLHDVIFNMVAYKAFFSSDTVREGLPLIGVFLEGTTPTC